MNLLTLGVAVVATNLPPVIVEATRLGHTTAETPAYTQVISAQDIAASGARDIAELLRYNTTSLNLISSHAGNPVLSSVSAAGYGETGFGRFLVLIDGQRINYPDMAAPLLSQFNLGSVSQIEILHGAQSVLHGDGASAGALNIVTEPPDYAHHGKLEAHAGTWDSYGARAAYRGGDETEGLKWWSSGGWNRSRGFRSNDRWQLWNLSGGLKKEWTDATFLRLSTFWNQSNYALPGTQENPTPYDAAKRQTVGINLAFQAQLADDWRAKLETAFATTRSRAHYGAPPYTSHLLTDVYSSEVTPQLIYTGRVGAFENELLLGTTYRLEQLMGSSNYAPDYDYTRQTMAFFAQDTLHLTDTLALEAGARYQRLWSKNTTAEQPRKTSDLTAADLALLFTPRETLKTYLRVSRFFRAPFLDETPYHPITYAPAHLLNPEEGYSVALGGEWRLADEFTVFTDVSLSHTTDEILYEPIVWGTNVNAPDDIIRKIFTVGGTWARDKVASVTLSYTYADAEFEEGIYQGRAVPLSAKSTVLAQARVWLGDSCSLFGGYRFRSSRFAGADFANEKAKLAAVSLFHVGLRYEPTWRFLKGAYCQVLIDNLFDRTYNDYAAVGGTGDVGTYPAPGRSLTVTLGWEF